MKKRIGFSLAITGIVLCSFVSDTLPKEFQAALDRAKMTFEAPSRFAPTKVIDNDQVGYNYAMKIRDPDKKFEVRYLVMPLDSMLLDYQASLKDTSRQVL